MALLTVVMIVLSVVGGARLVQRPGEGLAGEATVSASSTQLGYSARDVVTSGSASRPGPGWRSGGQTVGAWVQLAWPTNHPLQQLTLVRNDLSEAGISEGYLSFSDGSRLSFPLSHTSRISTISFQPRSVDRVRFTVTAVMPGTAGTAGAGPVNGVVVSELLVSTKPVAGGVVADDAAGGDVALSASTVASPDIAVAGLPRLHDSAGPAATGPGATWTAPVRVGDWLQYQWSQPHEIASIAVVGAAAAGRSTFTSATLSFSDGSSIPLGAVLADPRQPTVLAFLPRVVSSVRLTITGLSGTEPLALTEWRVYQRGSTPYRPTVTSAEAAPASTACPDRADAGVALQVLCPTPTSAVGVRPTVSVAVAAGYTSVQATVWSADADRAPGTPVTAQPSGGIARLDLDLSGIGSGPLTVRLVATGRGQPDRTADLPLYRPWPQHAPDQPPSALAGARTLVDDDEFDAPISASRTGADTSYAGSKPTASGVQDFGDAIFGDPATDPAAVGVVDDSYLRIGVRPLPAGQADPDGFGRSSIGGLLASARPGGSGFSAQYGYFEARMATSVGEGTWPAFWTLPSDNLIAATPAVAEIDAVELYGHDPTGACQSTHQFIDGHDGGVANCGRRFDNDREALAWHTYGVDVAPAGITFYIDGRQVATAPQVRGGSAPLFFLLDLALGGGWPVDLAPLRGRAVLYVDYVRVYV